MLLPRIIPCLLIHKNGLVKTTNFKNHKYIGDPINAVRIFNEKKVDEILILDIDASVSGKEPSYNIIEKIASECRMPMCYGGGIKTLEQAQKIISLGSEKVALSSGAINNPSLIKEIVKKIGSQSVVVVLDVKKRILGGDYNILIENGQTKTEFDLFDFVRIVEDMGAGECVINSIDHDGLMNGYDLSLAVKMMELIHIPITFLGGAGNLSDINSLFKACGVVGAGAGSLFLYKGKFKAVLINYPSENERKQILKGF